MQRSAATPRGSKPARCKAVSRTAVCIAAVFAVCAVSPAQTILPDAPPPASDLAYSAALPVPQTTFPPQAEPRHRQKILSLRPSYVPIPRPCRAQSCSELQRRSSCCEINPDLFEQYLLQTSVHVYTPRELGLLAVRSVTDPFNLLTIVGTSAFSVATDSHSPYGPGFMGWAKFSGVSITQDMTGEFFGTFLIPSIDHQDPHYHREPNARIPRRILHCVLQPFWTDSDTGRGMPNYSTLVGSIGDEAIDDAYVPYREVGWNASAQRVAIGWATAPIGNFVTEFVPDVARHINLRVVFVQRIINRVAIEEAGAGTGSPPPP